jgi:hypothetical protein
MDGDAPSAKPRSRPKILAPHWLQFFFIRLRVRLLNPKGGCYEIQNAKMQKLGDF